MKDKKARVNIRIPADKVRLIFFDGSFAEMTGVGLWDIITSRYAHLAANMSTEKQQSVINNNSEDQKWAYFAEMRGKYIAEVFNPEREKLFGEIKRMIAEFEGKYYAAVMTDGWTREDPINLCALPTSQTDNLVIRHYDLDQDIYPLQVNL